MSHADFGAGDKDIRYLPVGMRDSACELQGALNLKECGKILVYLTANFNSTA